MEENSFSLDGVNVTGTTVGLSQFYYDFDSFLTRARIGPTRVWTPSAPTS